MQEEFEEHLYQMAYCSVACSPITPALLKDILTKANAHNSAHGITGTLMADQGLFIQWLEGPKQAVRDLWARILDDPRHHCIVELMHNDSWTTRMFPNWSMSISSREDMLEIVHEARDSAQETQSPWAPAIATLCILLDTNYSQAYGRLSMGAAEQQTPAQVGGRRA